MKEPLARVLKGAVIEDIQVGWYQTVIRFADGRALTFETSAPGPNDEPAMLVIRLKDGEKEWLAQ